jgi:hypothetical protein
MHCALTVVYNLCKVDSVRRYNNNDVEKSQKNMQVTFQEFKSTDSVFTVYVVLHEILSQQLGIFYVLQYSTH